MSELDLYIKNQEALLEQYNGKIIALHGGKVQWVFESKVAALNEM